MTRTMTSLVTTALLAASAGVAHADDITVPGDFFTITAAIASATDGAGMRGVGMSMMSAVSAASGAPIQSQRKPHRSWAG